mgnify:CR=1 FL=1
MGKGREEGYLRIRKKKAAGKSREKGTLKIYREIAAAGKGREKGYLRIGRRIAAAGKGRAVPGRSGENSSSGRLLGLVTSH